MAFTFSWFSKAVISSSDSELPDIYPLGLHIQDFITADIAATFRKILVDTLERTHGIPDEIQPLLWDNCVQNESQEGLVSLLVGAIVKKSDLFLVYKSEVGVLRVATNEEQQKIVADYKSRGESDVGIFISFRNYRKVDMLRIYSELEYCILSSLHKSVNISRAVQIKMDQLRASVSLSDSKKATDQAKSLASALSRGRDIFLDKNDEITTATPNIAPTESAIGFLDAKRAFYLDLPLSYISGLQTTGIGATGEADMRAIERGLKQYFFSIIHPTLLALFDIDTTFKSEDFRQVTSALEMIKTFELVSDELLSKQSKREIIARMFDVDPEDELKAIEAEAEDNLETPPPTELVPPNPGDE